MRLFVYTYPLILVILRCLTKTTLKVEIIDHVTYEIRLVIPRCLHETPHRVEPIVRI
jgi:hypothetical protein